MRTKKVTLAGKEYVLAYSAQSQINMDALRRKPDFDPKTHGAEFAFEMLYEELRAGYRWAVLNGQTAEEPPAKADLADMVGDDDIMEIMGAINEVALGVRNVVARPPKKETAGESED